eukprot:TRINITY_DN27655_c0_g1_i1.p1 TRINITY_DN27655_c0_g1~~TRINITY_DN27655_c0_g1_i1.p1  ORF type:complete len:646 (+),score=197.96 TRINITY_DN27655_c0_g1_i1:58-1995(+)
MTFPFFIALVAGVASAAVQGKTAAPDFYLRPDAFRMMQILGKEKAASPAILGQTGGQTVSAQMLQAAHLATLLAVVVVGVGAYCCLRGRHEPGKQAGDDKDVLPSCEAQASAAGSSSAAAGSLKGGDEAADFESLLQTGLKLAAQKFGPKLAKGLAVRNAIQTSMYSFPGKVKSLVTDQLAGVVGTLLSSLEAEEAMLLLDVEKAVAANFPAMATLLAGVLSPTLLSLAKSIAMAQLFVVIIPVLILCSWALWQDYDAVCSIPTMFLWTKAQFGMAVFLGFANGMVAYKILSGKKTLDAKTQDMQKRLAVVKQKSFGEMGSKELQELFVCNSVLVEEALLVEDSVKGSVWHNAVGVGTSVWLLMIVWTFVIVFGWTFVPGVTAFAKEASASPNYCNAWASVFTARLICVLSLLFLVVNVLVVAHWLVILLSRSTSFASAVLNQAKTIDDSSLGLPLAELFAKAFLLRGSPDTYGAQLAVANAEKARLEAEHAALEKRLRELDAAIDCSAEEVKAVRAETGVSDELSAAPLSAHLEEAEEVGFKTLQEAEKQAAALGEAATKELERLLEKFSGFAEQLQESEAYQAAKAKAQELANTDLQTAAQEAARQASAAAQEAALQANSAAEQLRQSEVLQTATAKAREALR